MTILFINGPNLNATGVREKEVYGTDTLEQINNYIEVKCAALGIAPIFYQTSSEGSIIDRLYMHDFDGVVLNAGAFAHYSYAIRDCIAAISQPVIEVHMSNISSREPFRATSVLSAVCSGTMYGMGKIGYYTALIALQEMLI